MATNLILGCSYSNLWVHPKNWRTTKSKNALEQNWYVECKFYDPEYKIKYPKGFSFRKKLNRFKTLSERKAAIEILLEQIPVLFEEKHFNPITKKYMKPMFGSHTEELSNMWFIDALEYIYPKLAITPKTKKDIKSTVRALRSVGIKMYPALRACEIHSGHIRDMLDYLEISNSRFNKHLSYLSIVFNELVEKRVLFHNPIRDIKRRKEIKRIRRTMTLKDFKEVLSILKKDHYSFYIYSVIFFYSGARSSELLKLKAKDVDIKNQEYKVVIKKGREYKETIKVIVKDSIPYWKEVLKDVDDENLFIFSKGLVPGAESIQPYQITKRWKRLVKDKYDIEADFYSLKHLFLDLIDESYSDFSSEIASHTSNEITNKFYLTGKKKREMDKLKNLTVNIE